MGNVVRSIDGSAMVCPSLSYHRELARQIPSTVNCPAWTTASPTTNDNTARVSSNRGRYQASVAALGGLAPHAAHASEFAGAFRLHPKSKDPLIGTQDPAESIFVMPQAGGGPPIEVTGLSSFVTTKAAAYVFLPSITAIKFIADLGEGV
jgi:hypothetical protein